MSRPDANRLMVFLLLGVMAVATGFADLRMRTYPRRAYEEYIPAVVSGYADAPERYRVLVPYTTAAFGRITHLPAEDAWDLTRLAWIFAAYVILYAYLHTWFSAAHALLGALLVAATLPLTFTNSWAHPDHMAELALFTAGCLAVARGRDGWFAAILIVSSLNRETTAFLVLLYAVAAPRRPHVWIKAAGFGAIWFAIYAGLRFARGFVAYDVWQWHRNLSFFRLLPAPYDPYYRAYAYFFLVLFVPMLLLGLRGVRTKPFFVRRALLVVPVFVAVCLTMSSVIETRIFTPLYGLMLPSLMFSIVPADRAAVDLAQG